MFSEFSSSRKKRAPIDPRYMTPEQNQRCSREEAAGLREYIRLRGPTMGEDERHDAMRLADQLEAIARGEEPA